MQVSQFWSSVILGKYATIRAVQGERQRFWSSVILGKYATGSVMSGAELSFGAASFWVSTQP